MWEASCTGDDLDFINNPGSVVRLAQSATLHVEALEAIAGVGNVCCSKRPVAYQSNPEKNCTTSSAIFSGFVVIVIFTMFPFIGLIDDTWD